MCPTNCQLDGQRLAHDNFKVLISGVSGMKTHMRISSLFPSLFLAAGVYTGALQKGCWCFGEDDS